MKISQDKAVALTFKLIDVNLDKVLEEATAEMPLEFIFGTNTMVPAFEKELEGLEQGASFEFILEEDTFGHRVEENVTDLPLNLFFDETGKVNYDIVKEGEFVPLMDSEGNKYQGLVLEIGEETIKIDFNHPYAGRILKFSGDILNVREASDEELNALFAQMNGSGGCGCSCASEDQGVESGGCGCSSGSEEGNEHKGGCCGGGCH